MIGSGRRAWLVCAVLMLLGMFATVRAETGYVTDRLLLGIYAEPDSNSQQYRTLASGTLLDIKERQGLYARVVTEEGLEGWVKYHFLVADPPAVIRIKALEEQESDVQAAREAAATTARNLASLQAENLALNEQLLQLKTELEARQAADVAAAETTAAVQIATESTHTDQAETTESGAVAEMQGAVPPVTVSGAAPGLPQTDWPQMEFELGFTRLTVDAWLALPLVLGATVGFGIGANWMSRRVRRRFSGIRVW